MLTWTTGIRKGWIWPIGFPEYHCRVVSQHRVVWVFHSGCQLHSNGLANGWVKISLIEAGFHCATVTISRVRPGCHLGIHTQTSSTFCHGPLSCLTFTLWFIRYLGPSWPRLWTGSDVNVRVPFVNDCRSQPNTLIILIRSIHDRCPVFSHDDAKGVVPLLRPVNSHLHRNGMYKNVRTYTFLFGTSDCWAYYTEPVEFISMIVVIGHNNYPNDSYMSNKFINYLCVSAFRNRLASSFRRLLRYHNGNAMITLCTYRVSWRIKCTYCSFI
jgi:hypothetical protein